MDLIFNELSAYDKATDVVSADSKMTYLLETCKEMYKHGFNKLRVHNDYFLTQLSKNYTINDWVSKSTTRQTEKELLLKLFKRPFIDDNDDDTTNSYIKNKITFVEPNHHDLHNSIGEGISTAWIKNSICVSFYSHKIWEKALLDVEVETDDSKKTSQVPNVHRPESCTDTTILDWLKAKNNLILTDKASIFKKYTEQQYRFEEKAIDDILYFIAIQKLDFIQRIEHFLQEILISHFLGTGKPEPLKGSNYWARRINDEHRLIYKVEKGIIIIASCKGHYE